MTTFNPENKETITYREALGPVSKITDQDDADQYLAAYIAYIERHLEKDPRTDGKSAEWVAKQNIGYWSGYYNPTTMARIQKLFRCYHPILGGII